jgi:hypothetical protein
MYMESRHYSVLNYENHITRKRAWFFYMAAVGRRRRAIREALWR